VAIVPALFATVLIFMDQQITAVIVNRKEHKLVVGGNVQTEKYPDVGCISCNGKGCTCVMCYETGRNFRLKLFFAVIFFQES
jgi:hypothetical protein